jgi:hypothetical protein
MAFDGNPAQIVLSASDRTRAAFESAKRNIAGLKTAAAGIGGVVTAALGPIGLLGGAISAISFTNVVDGIDRLNDIKDATGASIENISALEDVADRSGTSVDTVADALVKLNKQLTEAKPGSQIEATLKNIGLNAEELRRLDPADALLQVAKALDQYQDSGSKARTITALTGKSVQELASFLKDLAETGKLNATVTTRQGEEAEKFNKQLFQLQTNIKGAARELVSSLIPALNEFLDDLRGARAEGAGGSLFDGIFGTNPVAKLRKEADLAAAEVTRAGDVLDRLVEEQSRKGAGTDARLETRIAKARERLDGLRATASTASEKLKDLANVMDGGPKAAAAVGPDAAKPIAPEPPDVAGANKASAEALANLRKVVDGNVKAIGNGLQQVQDELRFGEQASQQLYSLGLQSLERFYADQDAARNDNLTALRQATAAEIAEREKLLASPLLKGPDKASERTDIANQIAEARARLGEAERKADQDAKLSVEARKAAVQALSDQVKGLDAQIRDLATGGSAASDLQQISEQVNAARKLFVQGGESEQGADVRAQQLGRLLETQRQLNLARQNFALISQQAANAEERLLLAAERNGDGLLEIEDKVHAARAAALAQLEQLIESTRALATANPGNAQLRQDLEELELQAERTRAALDPRKLRLDAAVTDAASALTDGLREAVLEGGKLSDIIANIDKRLASIVLDEAVFKPFQQGLANILKGAGGQGIGENVLGAVLGLNRQQSPALTTGDFARADRGQASDVGVLDQLLGFFKSFFGGGVSAGDVAKTVVGFGGGTLAGTGAAAAGEAASSAAITAAIATASGSETAALSAAIATASASETAALTAAIATGLSSSTLAITSAITGSTAAITAAIAASGAADATGDAVSSAAAAFAGFDTGGYTGDVGVNEPAGVVHGKEFVISAPAVKRIGVRNLEALHAFGRGGAARPALTPRSFAIGGYVRPVPQRAAAAPAPAPARAANGPGRRAPVAFHYHPAPGESRATGLQTSREMARELQRGLRNA